MNVYEQLRPFITNYIQEITKKNQYGMYVCPFCASGTGQNKTPAGAIDKETNKYKCFSCGEYGDIVDICMKYENLNRALAIEKLKSKYLISNSEPFLFIGKKDKGETQKDYTTYINECKQNLHLTDYYLKRGISHEVAETFNLGYDPKRKSLIIPKSQYSYTERFLTPLADGTRFLKHGENEFTITNIDVSKVNHDVFITEGEIDALSIISNGFNAISLNSINNINNFVNYLKEKESKSSYILALDNDDKGKTATQKLSELLKENHFIYKVLPLSIYNGLKDLNDVICGNNIQLLHDYINKEFNMMNSFLNDIIKHNLENQNKIISTGFKELDKALNGGFTTGLYILGAISSLGKTTFLLQIADYLAQYNHDVLIFSLEQSRKELFYKSLSRLSYFNNNHKSAIEIAMTKDITQNLYKEFSFYRENISKNLFIYESIGDVTTEHIYNIVNKHIRTRNKTPIVIIDYLQILAPIDKYMTDKQNIDKAVTNLRLLARDFNLPVIAISSLNRENYTAEIDLTAFKESGAIEYSSDVLLGLQFKGQGEKNFNIKNAKTKKIRDIQLKILKNRLGKTHGADNDGINFQYTPEFNVFIETPAEKKPSQEYSLNTKVYNK